MPLILAVVTAYVIIKLWRSRQSVLIELRAVVAEWGAAKNALAEQAAAAAEAIRRAGATKDNEPADFSSEEVFMLRWLAANHRPSRMFELSDIAQDTTMTLIPADLAAKRLKKRKLAHTHEGHISLNDQGIAWVHKKG